MADEEKKDDAGEEKKDGEEEKEEGEDDEDEDDESWMGDGKTYTDEVYSWLACIKLSHSLTGKGMVGSSFWK